MIDIMTYGICGILTLIGGYLYLHKIYDTTINKKEESLFFNGYAKAFYVICTVLFSVLFIVFDKSDFIVSINYLQFFIPLLLLGVIAFYPKQLTVIISCLIMALLVPKEALSNYIDGINIYINKTIMFLFLISFSFVFQKQKSLPGVSFIQMTAFGATLFALYFLSATPKLYSLFGVIIATLSVLMFQFAKMPSKIKVNASDNKLLSVFVAWVFLLGCSEYNFYPLFCVFSMFFINALFKLFLKAKNFNFKENYDIYILCINNAGIKESDLYLYIIKSYFAMFAIAVISAKIPNPSSAFVVACAFGAWFLYRAYNLYQNKTTWKSIYREAKEEIKGKINDKDA